MQETIEDYSPAGTHYRYTPGSGDVTWVLIHGVGLRKNMWRYQHDSLSRHGDVVSYDMLGHGQSANPPGERTFKDFAMQLEELVAHLKLQNIAVVGFSMGSLVALVFAALFPEKIDRLALLHSYYKRTEEECAGVRARFEMTKQQGISSTVDMALERWFSQEYIQHHPEVMDQIREGFEVHPEGGYIKAYGLFSYAEEEIATYDLKTIRCPVLVMTGDQDVGSTVDIAHRLAADLNPVELIINKGHKHMAPVEHARTISDQLIKFLSSDKQV